MDTMPTERAVAFHATVLQAGKTATGVVVPDTVVAALGVGKRPPVHVAIRGYTYRSTIAVMGGRFMLGISAQVREGAGVAAGDDVEIELVLDSEPRVIAVPPDFAAALAEDAPARSFFDGLSYSNRRRFVESIEGAKSEETRARRIAASLEKLRTGRT
jgi:hypothetical protein